MKEINLYLRVHQVRRPDKTVAKYIGCLLLDYRGKHKYTFFDDIEELNQSRCMLKLVILGIKMLKEPCKINVLTLNWIGELAPGGEIIARNLDLADEILQCLVSSNHVINFTVCKDKNDEVRAVFNRFKSELDKYKRRSR